MAKPLGRFFFSAPHTTLTQQSSLPKWLTTMSTLKPAHQVSIVALFKAAKKSETSKIHCHRQKDTRVLTFKGVLFTEEKK